MAYGIIIRKIRDSLNMTLEQFAVKVDISKSHIQRMEKEQSSKNKETLSPPLEKFKRICDSTGYDFRQFLIEAGYIEMSEIEKRYELLEQYQRVTVDAMIDGLLEGKKQRL